MIFINLYPMAYPFSVPISTPVPVEEIVHIKHSKLMGLSSSVDSITRTSSSNQLRPRPVSVSPRSGRARTQSLTYYYRASVFKTDDRYEIHINVQTERPELPTPANKGELVYDFIYNSWKFVRLYQLSYMLMRKFQPQARTYQQTDGEVTIDIHPIMSREECLFTCIYADLEFIKNIIKTEIDFHVGKRVCMRAENQVALKKYTEDMTAEFEYKQNP